MATKKKATKKKIVRKKTSQKKSPSRKAAGTATKKQSAGPAVGKPVASFGLPSTDAQTVRLSNLKGKHIVLYFYPRDSTPGCTIEGRDFRDRHAEFIRHNCVIFGVSRDNLKRHDTFRSKENFPFHLLADESEVVCKQFDVIKPKNMYGKMVRGIERSTFLIDKNGVLRQEWRKVKIAGHADEVLAAVKAL